MKKLLITGLLLLLLGLTDCGTVQAANNSSASELDDRITQLEAKVSALENIVNGTIPEARSGIGMGLDSRVEVLEQYVNTQQRIQQNNNLFP